MSPDRSLVFLSSRHLECQLLSVDSFLIELPNSEEEAVVAAEAVTDEDALPKTKSTFVSVFREEADGKKEKRMAIRDRKRIASERFSV